MQSKMYARGVRCSDCHDVHSIRRIKDGKGLCLQCHRAAVYDSQHHFHKKKGEAGDPIRSPAGEVLFDVVNGAHAKRATCPDAFTWASIIARITVSVSRGRILR